MQTAVPTISSERSGHSWWAFAPVALLGSLSLMLGFMVKLAVDDPGFALEADYYNKAVHWSENQAQIARNTELGWRAEIAQTSSADGRALRLTLTDKSGQRLSGANVHITALFNARASLLHQLNLTATEPGIYEAAFRPTSYGLWEFRIQVTRGDEVFTQVLRTDLD